MQHSMVGSGVAAFLNTGNVLQLLTVRVAEEVCRCTVTMVACHHKVGCHLHSLLAELRLWRAGYGSGRITKTRYSTSARLHLRSVSCRASIYGNQNQQ